MKFIKRLLIFAIFCALIGVSIIAGLYHHLKPELPDVTVLREVELQTPMLVYSADNKLMAQFGEKRRIPINFDEIPKDLINALIATEDSRFFEHHGIDPIGITRAAIVVAMSGTAKQGASTITQQLARNFFLSNEKKIMRKIKEIFIAIHIEQLLTKEEILELYINKVFLGYRSYGFGAAAQVYFNKDIGDLTLSEVATLAGMPKAPSTMNPLHSLERATQRRNIVLRRMLDEGYISEEEYQSARAEKIVAKQNANTRDIELYAPYMAEMARVWAVEKYGLSVYESGYRVYTSLDSHLQKAAETSTIDNLFAYDERHGYRGPVTTLWDQYSTPWSYQKIDAFLQDQTVYGRLQPAVVVSVSQKTAQVQLASGAMASILWDGMKWARPFINDETQGKAPKSAKEILKEGEQIWVRELAGTFQLSQLPEANTAMVAMSPQNGAIKALVGGFNFTHSKFNRVSQSVRQVGSSIKPFIYSAALDKGMTLATLVNDAPINKWDPGQGVAWRPKNSPPTYAGPTRLRIGLAQSKNVMAVRVLRHVGLGESIKFLSRFGFEQASLPYAESIALGAGDLTPLKMAQGFSVFANGGYYLDPYFIERVEDPFGKVIYKAHPEYACSENCEENTGRDPIFQEQNLLNPQVNGNSRDYAPRVLSAQNAFLVREMLEANIWGGGSWKHGSGWNGTGWRAQKPLQRRDIGGKTGTTNDAKDVWYTGYGPNIVATIWLGFDNHNRSLGKTSANSNLAENPIVGTESGAKTAQPGWINFMTKALENTPIEQKIVPKDIISVRIDRKTGLLTNKTSPSSSFFEYFEKGTEPTRYNAPVIGGVVFEDSGSDDELF